MIVTLAWSKIGKKTFSMSKKNSLPNFCFLLNSHRWYKFDVQGSNGQNWTHFTIMSIYIKLGVVGKLCRKWFLSPSQCQGAM